MKWIACTAALIVLGALIALWAPGEGNPADPASDHPGGAPPEASAPEQPEGGPPAGAPLPERREAVSPAAPGAPAEPALPEPRVEIEGRVLDPRGVPLSGVGVGVVEDGLQQALSESDGAGHFRIAVERLPVHLAPEDGVHVAARDTPVLAGGLGGPYLLIAALPAILGGRVEDEHGAPVPGARLELRAPEECFRDVALPLETTGERSWSALAGDDGRFRLPGVPAGLRGARLLASSPGYRDGELRVETGDPGEHVVRLEREAPPALVLFGRVTGAGGAPAPGVEIVLGPLTGATDGGGRFELALPDEPADRLLALEPGRGFALLDGVRERVAAARGRGESRVGPFDLTLPDRDLALSGHVLDEGGGPCAGWPVYLLDGTPLGSGGGGYPPRLAEGRSGEQPFEVRTGPDGAFRIGGLAERVYRLEARDPATALRLRSDPVPAGTDGVVLQVSAGDLRPRLRGRVLSRGGVPLGGVSVGVLVPFTDAGYGGGKLFNGTGTTTDAEGLFELADVPRGAVLISLRGRYVEPRFHGELPAGDEVFDVRVSALCRLRFEFLGSGEPPDRLRALDADGRRLNVTRYRPDGSSLQSQAVELDGGRSLVVGVPEETAELVLLRGGEELARVAVQLDPSRVNEVRY